jgi:hypothetical protein
MHIFKTLCKAILLLIPLHSLTQTYYIPQGSKSDIFLDRLEIKTRREGLNSSYQKPLNARLMVQEVAASDSLLKTKYKQYTSLNEIDKNNIQEFLKEYKAYGLGKDFAGDKKNNYHLFETNKSNLYLAINPVIQYRQGFESINPKQQFLVSAGINSQAIIAKKIGVQFFLTSNQERNPYYVRQFTNKYRAIPGFSNYTTKDSTTVNYIDFRGSMNFTLAKLVDVQFGYDRNFIGNGMRSLMLSDFSGNSLFLKLNTRLWKFNFENLYMQLTPQFGIVNESKKKKYLRINTLSINATKWLNIGIFDAVVFGREKQFELNYIQPFTFLRAMEQQSGSPDNALVGLNFKANFKQRFQVYGQLVLDEFKLSEIKASNGWWANKYGYQLGIKYIDALNIKNLDIQLESNRSRPFMYTHYDSVSNYSNNNIALAHPLGAGFQEYILAARYQPIQKLFLEGKLMYYYQGQDTAGRNFGNNFLIDYRNRYKDPITGVEKNYGYEIGSGNKATCTFITANISYELKNNLFLDVSIAIRNYKLVIGAAENTTMYSFGFRWNINKRTFEF